MGAGADLNFETLLMIPAGQNSHSFTVEVIDDSTPEAAEEYNIFIAPGPGFPNSWGVVVSGTHTITINPSDPPTASLNYSGSGMITPTDNVRMRIDLSESLSEAVAVTLVAGGTAAFSKNGGAGTWSLQYFVLPENSNPAASFPSRGSTDCLDDDITGTGCEIDIPMGHTVVDVLVDSELLASEQTIMVTLGVGSAGSTGLTTGTSSTVMLTAQ